MADKFWADAAIQPKRSYRWTVTFGTGDKNVPDYMAKKVSKPSFTVTETAHAYINHKFYYPGRVEWNTCTLTLVDAFSPNSAQKVLDIIKACGYQNPSDGNVKETMSKAKSLDALTQVVIHQLDDMGNALETWTLKNCWIKDVKFGELDYESDDMQEIELELRYDFATLKQGG